MCEILGSSESLPGDGKLLRSDARVETLHSDAVMAYTILPLWFGPTIMPHGVSRLPADPPGAFLAHLSHNLGHTCWCLRVLCRFWYSVPPGRIAGWLATVTSLATRLSQLARPDDRSWLYWFSKPSSPRTECRGLEHVDCFRYQTRTCLHIG